MNQSALNKIKITLVSVGTLFALLQSLPQAYALTLTPPRLEVTGEPGQLLQGELELYNEEPNEITFYVSSQNFEARGETGTPYFLPNDGSGLASWVSSEESVTLSAHGRIKFPYSIQVPQGAQPGGYFAAIFFGTTPVDPEAGGQVTIGGKVGTLIFLNIPGDAKEGAGILDFMTEKGNLFAYLPVEMSYRFSNDGARKVMPMGSIEIKNMLGKTAAVLDANEFKGNVLPESVRKFSMAWEEVGQDYMVDEKMSGDEEATVAESVGFFDAVKMQTQNFTLGRYTADLSLKYGLDEKSATAQIIFYIVPWQLLSLVTAVLLLVLIITTGGIKKYNKWLINKVKKENSTQTPVVDTIGTAPETKN